MPTLTTQCTHLQETNHNKTNILPTDTHRLLVVLQQWAGHVQWGAGVDGSEGEA